MSISNSVFILYSIFLALNTVYGGQVYFQGVDSFHHTFSQNATSNGTSNGTSEGGANDLAIGLVACGLSTIFFGSSFVPVKKFNTGDGMFFQWILCSAIWTAGVIMQLVRKSPPFQPFAMIGGLFWATGNICVIPILKTIGLSLGMLIWNTANLATGWASGRFGWFGIHPEVPKHVDLNYAGVIFAVLGGAVFIFVKSEILPVNAREIISTERNGYQPIPDGGVLESGEHINTYPPLKKVNKIIIDTDESWTDRLTPAQKKIVGVTLSLLSGVFYGVTFDPVTYLIDNTSGISHNGLDYVFSHYCGIFLTSTVYFIIYSCFKKNVPKVYPRAILPGIASGFMWAVAQSSWFVANQHLSLAVSFPIITVGTRNFILLSIAFFISLGGAVLSTLSKMDF